MSMIEVPDGSRRPSIQIPKLDTMTNKLGQFGQWASNQNWQGYGQFVTNSDFGQKVLVMNPMHMVQLSSKTKSRLVKIVEFCKTASEKWFSHWLLLVVLILYALIGAWVFVLIEGNAEMEVKATVIEMKDLFKKDIWYFTHTNEVTRSRLDSIIDSRLEEFEKQLYANFREGLGGDTATVRWTYWSAVVYCFTVFTTIGYGHIAPVTRVGRITTIIYACIGIPLLLMVLADLGRLFTRSVKYVLKTIRTVVYAKQLRGVRRAGRRATQAQQNLTQTLKSHGMKFMADVKDRRSSRNSAASAEAANEDANSANRSHPVTMATAEVPSVTITSPMTPYLHPTATTVIGPNGQPIVLLSPGICAPGTPNPLGGAIAMPGTPIVDASGNVIGGEVNDEFNLPVSLALLILFLYMLLGAFIFMNTDDWTFVDSIYFVFVSISTIGFGDLTPESEWCMIALSVYLLFGLALTSMCINVIQEQLAVAFEEAKLRLGNTMGFEVDPNAVPDGAAGSGGGDEASSGTRPKRALSVKPEEGNNSKSNTGIKKPLDDRKTTTATTAVTDSGFDLQKEGIGKNWKEKRDNKKKKPDAPQPQPVPTNTSQPSFSSFANQYQTSPHMRVPAPAFNLPVNSDGPPQTPKRTRAGSNTARRSVNFNQ